MLTGRTGRRVSPAPGKRKQAAGYRTNRKDAGGVKGQAGLLRLVVCGRLFVLPDTEVGSGPDTTVLQCLFRPDLSGIGRFGSRADTGRNLAKDGGMNICLWLH